MRKAGKYVCTIAEEQGGAPGTLYQNMTILRKGSPGTEGGNRGAV